MLGKSASKWRPAYLGSSAFAAGQVYNILQCIVMVVF